jgi:hypothetical protein
VVARATPVASWQCCASIHQAGSVSRLMQGSSTGKAFCYEDCGGQALGGVCVQRWTNVTPQAAGQQPGQGMGHRPVIRCCTASPGRFLVFCLLPSQPVQDPGQAGLALGFRRSDLSGHVWCTGVCLPRGPTDLPAMPALPGYKNHMGCHVATSRLPLAAN